MGHPVDLLTSISGFYAFFLRIEALIRNVLQRGAC